MFRKSHPPTGSSPGTLAISKDAVPPVVRVIAYDEREVVDERLADAARLPDLLARFPVTWVDIAGLGDEALLLRLGDVLRLHPLALADAVNVPQRPKSEDYEHHHFAIACMVEWKDGGAPRPVTEQLAIFTGKSFVCTIQERPGDTFDPVRRRIHAGGGPIRKAGPSYLTTALLDNVIDAYYPVLEAIGDQLEKLEGEIVHRPTRASLRKIHAMKRELLLLRRSVWPQREMVNAMIREEDPHVSRAVRAELRDCYDHAVQILEVLETYRELAGSFLEIYLSSVANRTNDVMKVLTIMATIFIPLTFIVGIYGMNFEHMPELRARYGYPILLVVMAGIAGAMLLYFRRMGWLERDPASPRARKGR